jgi:hypothetical protein
VRNNQRIRAQRLRGWSLKVLLVSLAACLSTANGAEPTAYKVEMLIFVNRDGTMATGAEPAKPLTGIEDAIDLQSGERGKFHALPASELALATAKTILEQSGRYDVIEDIAWVQPGLGENTAKAVHIHGGVEYQRPSAAPAPVFDNADLYSGAQEPVKLQQLDGTVKVALGHYFHVYADLVLRKPMTMQPVGLNQQPQHASTLYQFRIQDQRQMRSGELYYLDHPLLGVLVQITPIAKKIEDQERATSGLTFQGGNRQSGNRQQSPGD